MPEPLPGMPIRHGDPGVFFCAPGDIAPWEITPTAKPARPVLVPRPPAPRRRVWLVLAICPHCDVRTGRYCRSHDAENGSPRWQVQGKGKRALLDS